MIAGAVIAIFGLHFLGVLRIGALSREARIETSVSGRTPFGAYVLGLAFAFGWTPCIGPVLGSILSLAAQDGSVERGMLLMGFYAVGLGAPFLLTALFLRQAMGLMAGMKRRMAHRRARDGRSPRLVGALMLTGGLHRDVVLATRDLPGAGADRVITVWHACTRGSRH